MISHIKLRFLSYSAIGVTFFVGMLVAGATPVTFRLLKGCILFFKACLFGESDCFEEDTAVLNNYIGLLELIGFLGNDLVASLPPCFLSLLL